MPSYLWSEMAQEWLPAEQVLSARHNSEPDNRSDLPFPYIRGDLKPYVSPITGKIIEGRAARREDLARSGCREVDPSEYKPIYKNYEFCQAKRLPYMGADVPPPMTRDEKEWAKEKRAKAKAIEDTGVRAADFFVERVMFFLGATEAVKVFHPEFASAHQAKAGPPFIAKFGLNVVKIDGKLAI